MRSARTVITSRINMTSQSPGRGSRRTRGGRSRRGSGDRSYRQQNSAAKAPAKKTLWEKITGFFSGNGKQPPAKPRPEPQRNGAPSITQRPRASRKPESVEVTTPRLYVGNLSFEASESDLFELFNGVGQVQNAEVVTYKHNQRSKGFAFVQMQTVEEAKRAVAELHDKEFLGRKLVVSGANERASLGRLIARQFAKTGRRGGEPASPGFFIVGPTASGKSAIAAEVARDCGAEIISADAFQIYHGLRSSHGASRMRPSSRRCLTT